MQERGQSDRARDERARDREQGREIEGSKAQAVSLALRWTVNPDSEIGIENFSQSAYVLQPIICCLLSCSSTSCRPLPCLRAPSPPEAVTVKQTTLLWHMGGEGACGGREREREKQSEGKGGREMGGVK